MIKIYGSAKSRAFRCLWTLEELGVPYESIPIDVRKAEHRTSEFTKLNPAKKVPVLQDDSLTLFESAAICCYLADKYPERHLSPKVGTVERAYFYQWVSFITTELEQGLWTMGKHRFALPADKRIAQMQAVGAWEFIESVNVLEGALRGKTFLVNEMFSVADILAAHTLSWAKAFELPIGNVLEEYLSKLQQRPAFQKTAKLRADS